MSKQFKLKDVRLSFPSLFRKAVFQGESTKFEATFLLDKEKHKAVIDEIKAEINRICREDLKSKIPSDKICLKDGDDFEYDGYAGHYSIKATNNTKPTVVNRDRSPITEDDNVIYAGCRVNAMIELWAQNNGYGKRINCNLKGVQFFADDKPFGDGSKVAAASDFDAFENDATADSGEWEDIPF